MDQVITMRGIGVVTIKPDLIVLVIRTENRHFDYEKCTQKAEKATKNLRKIVAQKQFEKDALKTLEYEVTAEYTTDHSGHKVFAHWLCCHVLSLEFPLDINRLNNIIAKIEQLATPPLLEVHFSIANSAEVDTQLLKSATKNAKSKAETLCEANHAKLGELLAIDYTASEKELHSPTVYKNDYFALTVNTKKPPAITFFPEPIKVRDTITFTWAIK